MPQIPPHPAQPKQAPSPTIDLSLYSCLARARQLGDFAVEKFWGTNALPRASLKTDHYESVTGADTLALALLELHLQILHITAVRCPANTLDR